MDCTATAQTLADVARAYVARRHGTPRTRLSVVVHLDDALELEGVSVELAGACPDAADGDTATDTARWECLRDIIGALVQAGHRMTQAKVIAAVEPNGHNETLVRRTLAWAAAAGRGLLTKDAEADPPGYGLPVRN